MNLRKDHCRNLRSRTTRGQVRNIAGGGPPGRSPAAPAHVRLGHKQRTPARTAPRNRKKRCALPPSRRRRRGGGASSLISHTKRLSATDISALASMKNVAKCDTWCELQNPANHRVFERKLRPKPSGRGHACLGVTQRRHPAPPRRGRRGEADTGLPCAPARGWPKTQPPGDGSHGTRWSKAPAPRKPPWRAPSARGRRPRRERPHEATPGQAGTPAEFKHINKRRKRNLRGFP